MTEEKGFKGLDVYVLAYELAMDIFRISGDFPKSEIYALTNQVRRSSRAVCANLAEAYRKKRYPAYCVSKLTDCDAECSETEVWLCFAKDCMYISQSDYDRLSKKCSRVGEMLGALIRNPEKFIRKV
jgi:four helix bundle protein